MLGLNLFAVDIAVVLEGVDQTLWIGSFDSHVNSTTGCTSIAKKDDKFFSQKEHFKGRNVAINLVKDNAFVYDEPVNCVVGYKNPDLHVNHTEFCDLIKSVNVEI